VSSGGRGDGDDCSKSDSTLNDKDGGSKLKTLHDSTFRVCEKGYDKQDFISFHYHANESKYLAGE